MNRIAAFGGRPLRRLSQASQPLPSERHPNLALVRRKTLNQVIVLTAGLCIPLALSLTLQVQSADYLLPWVFATLVFAAAIVSLRKRLKYDQAAWALVILLTLIGIIATLYAGLLGGVLALTISVPAVVHTLLLPGRNSLLVVLLSLTISAVCAACALQLIDGHTLNLLLGSPITWVQSMLTSSLMCLVPLTFIWQLLQALQVSLTRIRSANRKIQEQIREQGRLRHELELRATHDSLTGIWNRGQFFTAASQEVAQAARYGQPASLLLLDIDYFKRINDQHGHAAGDRALASFAQVCRSCLREIDQLGRIGGEEFAVLLPQTDLDSALQIAEDIRLRTAEQPVSLDDGTALSMTVSIGIARQQAAESLQELLNRADQALYASKRRQRNCCTLAEPR